MTKDEIIQKNVP